jgi:hypothetical protein
VVAQIFILLQLPLEFVNQLLVQRELLLLHQIPFPMYVDHSHAIELVVPVVFHVQLFEFIDYFLCFVWFILINYFFFLFFILLYSFYLLKGQGPDPTGICGDVNKVPNVSVGGGSDSISCGVGTSCASLDYAIFGSLDTGSTNPTITLVGSSTLKQTVEITGYISSILLYIYICIFFL